MSFASPAESEFLSLSLSLSAAGRGIDALIQRDPGGRGLARWAEAGDLLQAAQSLVSGGRIAITTGFPILARSTIETDGPPGAIVLAAALAELGKNVVLLVDADAVAVIRAGVECLPVEVRPRAIVPLPTDESEILNEIGRWEFTHVLAVERPGRSAAGVCYSMRGEDLSRSVAPTDALFLAPGRPYATIGIGDGGNELGMGRVADRVDRYTGAPVGISCRTAADFCIYAGVSNWGAYGLCAALSIVAGRPLLPEPCRVRMILGALVDAGAVDGVTLERTATVDGLPLEEDLVLLEDLRQLLFRAGVGAGTGGAIPGADLLGDSALLWSWPGGIDQKTSREVLAVYRRLRDDGELRDAGMVDVVPAYCAVALHFDPARTDRDRLAGRARKLLADTLAFVSGTEEVCPAGETFNLPVAYDGPDLARVAVQARCGISDVIRRHCSAEYTVAMIGFRPHFPYLLGMDPRLETPRLDAPRKQVPAGSVGIAGAQTGVYPVDSPGGWNIIGRTDPELLRAIRPGDRVVFSEVRSA